MVDYQILLDIWEGNPDLNVETLKAAGVTGLIVRLNDMNGGHHMDEAFEKNWATARQFPAQTVYFVYNPWRNGRENFDWLVEHLPSDIGKRRIMVDVEVRYAGYSAETYAREVETFLALVGAQVPAAIYTGKWFLATVARWPVDVDYWWAAYPFSLQEHKSWESYREALEALDFAAFTRPAPGKARLWQCSGDGVILPGFGKHAVDVNVFPGTLDECKQWFHISGDAERPGEPSHEDHGTEDQNENKGEPAMAWRENPHVLVVYHGQTVDVAEARKQGYSAICAYLSEGDIKVDRSWLRELSGKCEGVIPLMVMWSVIPAYEGYSQGQRTADPQVNALMWMLENVEYQAVVMNIESFTKWKTNVVATPQNIGAATKAFYDTVVKQTGKPVYIRMTDEFVQKHTVDGNERFMSWIQGKNFWISEHAYRIVNGADVKYFYYPTGKVSMRLDEIRQRVYAPDVRHSPPDESKNPLVPEEAVKKFWEFSSALHVPTGYCLRRLW